ncbi:hypothetical protein KY329_00050 [Candidatus Woesearchaeota archaeon]|nr:hypothetical protein [Candidatus Woesearchaeota archaeon]
MKWMAIFVVFLMICSTVMAAEKICSDSDGGPEKPNKPDDHTLTTKGVVKQVVSEYEDTCLSFEDGYSTKEGTWLKEYYCDGDDLRETQYDCTNYGFSGCKNGECVGGSTSNTSGGSTPIVQDDLCGNKIKDAGEECDPPHSVCFGEDISEYGQCTTDCKCKLANAVAMKCGNGEIDEGETCESDNDCEHWEYCKKCLCVERPTGNTSVQNDTQPVAKVTTDDKEEVADKIDKKYPKKNITPVDIGNVTNFTKDPAIQTTSGIAKFFIGIWDWIVGLFS